MADFKTHLTGATLVSASGAAVLVTTEIVAPLVAWISFLLGVAGGLLPDLDARGSTTVRIGFTGLGVAAATLTLLALWPRLTPPEAVVLTFVTYMAARYGLAVLFRLTTVHRGLFHSIPAALGCGVATAWLADRVYAWPAEAAWVAGAALTTGFLIHLTLDEAYSVDIAGRRLKRSFGTALKLGRWRDWPATLLWYGFIAYGLTQLPPVDPLMGGWMELREGTAQVLERLQTFRHAWNQWL